MNKLCVIIGAITLLTSCKSIKTGNTFIPYLLPLETEQVIYDHIQTVSKDRKISVFFDFNKDGSINVWIDTSPEKYDENIRLSNRKLFVNNTFYPLTFNMDETFAVLLENDIIKAHNHCGYYKPKRKEVNEVIRMPSLAERKKLFPYVQEAPCQIAKLKIRSMRHQGFLFTMDIDGNVIKTD